MPGRRRTVAVIGSGSVKEGEIAYEMALKVGSLLIDNGFRVLTGGLGGVMEAAMKGARSSPVYHEGDTIAVIPGLFPEDANQYADIVISTGMGIGRNNIVTNADAIIAIGGGSGTLSEMALAWQKGKTIVSLDVAGWSREMMGRYLDDRRREEPIIAAGTADEAVAVLSKKFERSA
jgi:uncharacterized protein (TIGR00725 family)